MANLSYILRQEMLHYAPEQFANGRSWLTCNSLDSVFLVADESYQQGKRFFDVSMAARIEGDYIIIEIDMNNKPLVDALVAAGVPREQIVLAYAGETLPGPEHETP